MSFCPHCGSKIEAEDSSLCEKCGGDLPDINETPTEVIAEGPLPDEAPTEVIPSVAPTEVMPVAASDLNESLLPDPAEAQTGPVEPAPQGKMDRKKLLMIGGIVLVAAAAIAGGVLGFLELTRDSSDAPKAKTVVEVKTVEVDPEAEPLEEPFTLKVDTLDGSIPDGLMEMEYLLAEITIGVDNGDAYGVAQMPAISGDGTVIQGVETSLEIKGTYRNGVLKGTWNYYRPYGIADDNGSGEIESAGELTEEDASCLLTGSWFTVYDDGQSDPWELDVLTIHFKV